jgi:hypothetical protein
MLSYLKGNYATVKVPYEFSGNVLYAYANDHTKEEELLPPPFTKWDPQWKSGRYVTDTNICKSDYRGNHYAVEPEDCKGNAIYVSADKISGTVGYMWGVHFRGLRIAGAFANGIYCKNLNGGWTNDIRIDDTLIDACEIGVCLEETHFAYVSASIQGRRAFSENEVYAPYAKHGIKLVRSTNVDLSGSRVWDWEVIDPKITLWTDGGEYQHIAMIGNCNGAIINDRRYYSADASDIRKRIYTTESSNIEKMIVVQEPVTKWFKPINNAPYFCLDNHVQKRLITEEEFTAHFRTYVAKSFTDLLAVAPDTDGTLFGNKGYRTDIRLENDGTYRNSDGYYGCTGFIPCKKGDTINCEGLDLKANDAGISRIFLFDSNHNVVVTRNVQYLTPDDYYVNYIETENGFTAKICEIGNNNNVAYVRFNFHKTGIGENPMLAVNEELKYTAEGYLGDGIKVKAENIEGADEQGNFKSVDGVPYYSDGFTEREIITDESLGNYFDTGIVKRFTDVLASAEDTDGTVLNGVGYKMGARLSESGTVTDSGYYGYTGFIPCKKGDIIYAKDLTFDVGEDLCKVILYDANKNYIKHVNQGILVGGSKYFVDYTSTDDGFTLQINNVGELNNVAYARFTFYKTAFGDTPMMAVNENIEYVVEGFIADGIKVKGESVVLTSPSGKAYKLIVSDNGELSTELI